MAQATVKTIIEREAKSGIGSNGKPWSKAHVELDNGKTINIFNPINEGDVVESFKNGNYWNWRKVTSQSSQSSAVPTIDSTKLDQILKAIHDVYEVVTGEKYTNTTLDKKPSVAPQNNAQDDLPPISAYTNELDFGD